MSEMTGLIKTMETINKVSRDKDLIIPNITQQENQKIRDFIHTLGLFAYERPAKKE